MEQKVTIPITEILFQRSLEDPDSIAFTYLEDGEHLEINVSYAELYFLSKGIAQRLLQTCNKGDRVLLFYRQGLEFITAFFGCLYAGVIAVPSFPPRHNRYLHRLQVILGDCNASHILTTSSVVNNKSFKTLADRFEVIETDLISKKIRASFTLPEIKLSDIAFLQYTSGSTGAPKGVIISHDNIVSNQAIINACFNQDKNSTVVSWLPLYHDMGLIGGIIHPLYVGARGVLMSPQHFLQRPIRWLQAITKYKGTTSGGPNFSFDLCSERITEAELAGLDLSSWKSAFNGSEPVLAGSLDKFAQIFSRAGFSPRAFQPCYGMAEATLLISGSPYGKGYSTERFLEKCLNYEIDQLAGTDETRSKLLVSCGIPRGFDLKIVDHNGSECSEGRAGEIWIRGDSVSKGYWEKEEQHLKFFNAFLSSGEGPFFKTGDLGLTQDGELYITGRLKDLIIINGRNHYPQDIECTVNDSHPAIIKGNNAVFTVNDESGAESLVVVAEISDKDNSKSIEITDRVRSEISSVHEISVKDVVFVRYGTILKTTSGKIQRNACKDAYLKNTLQQLSPPEPLNRIEEKDNLTCSVFEEKIINLLIQLLNSKNFDCHTNLLSIGLNSIKISQLVMALNEDYDVDISQVFDYPTVHELAKQLESLNRASLMNIVPIPLSESYGLTPMQTAIWFDQQIRQESNTYNIPVLIDLKSSYINFLELALNTIISEQEILRTIFKGTEHGPVQVVLPSLLYKIETLDFFNTQEEKPTIAFRDFLFNQVRGPFNLECAPLFKVKVIKVAPFEHKLLLVAHHIISDGTSLMLLAQEILVRCKALEQNIAQASSLSEIQFKDYTHALNAFLTSTYKKQAQEFWHKHLENASYFELPAEFENQDKSKISDTIAYNLTSTLLGQIRSGASHSNCSVYMYMQAAFAVLLHKLTGENEVVIGVPVSGREWKETTNLLGVVVNTILLRTKFSQSDTVNSLLRQVRENIVNGIRFQNYPLAWLTKELELKKIRGHFPLTSIFFNGLGFLAEDDSLTLSEVFSIAGMEMNIDLNCYIKESREGLQIRMDYNKARFSGKRIKNILHVYENILSEMCANPESLITKISRSSFPENRRAVKLSLLEGTKVQFCADENILTLIEKQALKTPHHTALVFGDKEITYRELNGKANALATQIKSQGGVASSFIPVLIPKSPELLIAIMAIWKCEAAYIPFDLAWPLERQKSLLIEINPQLILVDEKYIGIDFSDYYSFSVSEERLEVEEVNCHHNIPLESPIYGLFTSGTTGLPKCAINLHKGILNRFLYMNKVYNCTPADAILYTSNSIFDASVWQMFWPLMNGASVVIPTVDKGIDLHELVDLVSDKQITITDFVPSVFNVFVDYIKGDFLLQNKIRSLRHLLIGGEAMNPVDIKSFRNIHPTVGITNTYGPTEASIGTVFYHIGDNVPEIIPIGKPIDNVITVILDDLKQPVPVGTTGHLYLGGVCLGSGYLNNPRATAAVFIKNPINTLSSAYLYNTGDLAYLSTDGDIYYQGRRDDQVKLRGVRIELGEIENCLNGYYAVRQAVLKLVNESSGDILVAFVCAKVEVSEQELRTYLKGLLPDYMCPSKFVFLKEFPVNNSGKIDKNKLTSYLAEDRATAKKTLPRNKTERLLADIWCEVLDLKVVGVEDNFFSLGGHSLNATQIVSRIREVFNVDLPLHILFDDPTICRLTAVIKQLESSGPLVPIERIERKPA